MFAVFLLVLPLPDRQIQARLNSVSIALAAGKLPLLNIFLRFIFSKNDISVIISCVALERIRIHGEKRLFRPHSTWSRSQGILWAASASNSNLASSPGICSLTIVWRYILCVARKNTDNCGCVNVGCNSKMYRKDTINAPQHTLKKIQRMR